LLFNSSSEFFDKILIDYFWRKSSTQCITISPKALTRDKEVYWKYAVEHTLISFQHFCVYERSESGRLHLHGVIKAKRTTEQLFHGINGVIGFCKFSKNPKKQWYDYLFKQPVDFIYKVGPHIKSTQECHGWFDESDPMIDATAPAPAAPGPERNEGQDLNLAKERETF